MEINARDKRSRRNSVIVLAVFAYGAMFIMMSAKHLPRHMRVPIIHFGMGFGVFPLGFYYGRNIGRKDLEGKVARGALLVGLLGLCFYLFPGGVGKSLGGMPIGFLCGYAVGLMVHRKSLEKFGETPEADRYFNVPKQVEATSANEYLNSLDEPTRKSINRHGAYAGLISILGFGLGTLIASTGCFASITRALYLHSGDGTRFFFTPRQSIARIPLGLFLSFQLIYVYLDLVVPWLLGSKKVAWQEYQRLSATPAQSRNAKIMTNAFSVMALLSLILFTDSYVKVTNNGLDINGFWGLGTKHHTWANIRDLEYGAWGYTVNQKKQEAVHYVTVRFDDGSNWTPDPSDLRSRPEYRDAIRYIESHYRK